MVVRQKSRKASALAALGFALFIQGCGGTSPTAAASPSPSAVLSPTQSPSGLATPSESPSPSANGWKTYSSADYGYSLQYPPTWFDLGSFGVGDEHYFSTDKAAGAPTYMRPDAIFVGVSANCQYWLGPNTKLISQASIEVDGVPAIRYVADLFSPDGNFVTAITTIKPGAYCYRIYVLAFTLLVVQANLADFDRMLSTVRFSTRTAPAVSPIATTPPS